MQKNMLQLVLYNIAYINIHHYQEAIPLQAW